MKNIITALAALLVLSGCSKEQPGMENEPAIILPAEIFTEYKIAEGSHYCNLSAVTPITRTQMLFKVRFDSSAIYTSLDPQNQYDINKLYGFSEGYDPHVNSARIGWSYNYGKLRLYAYVYSNGVRSSLEICSVNLFDTISCAILVKNDQYVFSVNNVQVQLSRALSGALTNGYQLFPYFGGDETAPHAIRIWIKDL